MGEREKKQKKEKRGYMPNAKQRAKLRAKGARIGPGSDDDEPLVASPVKEKKKDKKEKDRRKRFADDDNDASASVTSRPARRSTAGSSGDGPAWCSCCHQPSSAKRWNELDASGKPIGKKCEELCEINQNT